MSDTRPSAACFHTYHQSSADAIRTNGLRGEHEVRVLLEEGIDVAVERLV